MRIFAYNFSVGAALSTIRATDDYTYHSFTNINCASAMGGVSETGLRLLWLCLIHIRRLYGIGRFDHFPMSLSVQMPSADGTRHVPCY